MAIQLQSLNKVPAGGMPPLITVYGIDGIGKTALGLGAQDVVYLPTEQRFGGYSVTNMFQTEEDPSNICGSFEEMCDGLTSLAEQDHEFKTVVIDSLDHLEPLIWKGVLDVYPFVHKGDPVHRDDTPESGSRKIDSIVDYGYGKGYTLALEAWRYFFKLLQDLRKKGMTVVLVAHFQQKQERPADGDDYDQYQIKLHKSAAHLVRELSDLVLFMKLKQFTKKSGKGFNETSKAIGDADRIIVCKPNLSYTVKNSFGLPDEIPMNWDFSTSTEQNCQSLFWSVAQHIPYFQKGE